MTGLRSNAKLIGALLGVSGTLAAGAATAGEDWRGHAVFVMTNDASANEVIAFDRADSGALGERHHYRTEGRGSGGKVDPLASQGSLILSRDKAWLFAVNAGSGTLSAFRVQGSKLQWSDKIATGGSEPNSVTQHGNLVYVLNTAGSSSVVGFRFEDGKFSRVRDSLDFLSANAVASGSVAFSPDGHFLMVTEKATNSIDVFRVLADGTLSAITVNTEVGAGTFSANFAPNGTALVTETGPAGPKGAPIADASAISSYAVQSDGTLKAVSVSVPTLGTAACWDAITEDGRYVYVSNSASSSIAGFAVGSGGTLTPLPGTLQAVLASGSVNLDLAISGGGKYLYSLNAANGTIGEFAINAANGSLSSLGVIDGLPASEGLNGIAAN